MSAESTPRDIRSNPETSHRYSDSEHQRREKLRIALPNLAVKIKSSGFGSKSTRETCPAIDISSHGFAFAASQTRFKALDKVQFTLVIGDQQIDGKGVICYAREQAEQTHYGVLFIATSQPVTNALARAFAQSSALEDYAVQAAEKVWSAVAEDKINAQCLQQQYKLFSAVNTFRQRLAQLEQEQPGHLLQDRLQLDESNFAIKLNISSVDSQAQWVDISASHNASGETCFAVGTNVMLESTHEVIEYIAQVYRTGLA